MKKSRFYFTINKTFRFLVFIFLFTVYQPTYPQAPDNQDFPQFRYDIEHTGTIPINAPVTQPHFAWAFIPKNKIIGAPISSKGFLYFGDLSNFFYCVNGKTGQLKWFKTLKKIRKTPIGIYNSPIVYKNLVIVANGDGYVYGFNKENGKVIWGPKYLEAQIHSSPVINKNLLFITTIGEGYLWILDPNNGETALSKTKDKKIVIGQPVYSTPIVDTKSFYKSPTNKSQNFFQIYITTPSKLIKYLIEIKPDRIIRQKDLPIEGSIVSSPVLKKSNLFFSTRQFLYNFDILSGKKAWVKRVKPISIHPDRTTYPSPVIINDLIIQGTRGYKIKKGTPFWHFWTYGKPTTDSLATNNILYLGGQYTLYKKKYGFLTGIYIKTEGVKFWLDFASPPITSPIIANNMLYIAVADGRLFAFK